MWFRVTKELFLWSGGLVGFFVRGTPGVPGGQARGAAALMKDGSAVPVPLGTKVLAARYAGAAPGKGIRTDGNDED